jgi:hypothetical protein
MYNNLETNYSLPYASPVGSDITPMINTNNVNNIRTQIYQKTGSTPFFATAENVVYTLTDHDTFPYPRYYRGVVGSSTPVIAEREAGWRKREDSCYDVRESKKHNIPEVNPNNCFQSACSTVYPCYPEYMTKYSDKEAMDLILNRTCIAQYR